MLRRLEITGKPQGRWGSSRSRIESRLERACSFFMENAMANWSKRRSTKSGTHSRTTTTTNNKGGSTRSTSVKVGSSPRVTESVKQENGKVTIRRYTTEYHPTLGTKRSSKTVYNTKQTKTPKPKKWKKPKTTRSSKCSTSYNGTPFVSSYIPVSLPALKKRDWVKEPRGSKWSDTHAYPVWCHFLFWFAVGYGVVSLII